MKRKYTPATIVESQSGDFLKIKCLLTFPKCYGLAQPILKYVIER